MRDSRRRQRRQQMDAKLRQEIALFRFGLISDLKDLPPGNKGLYAKLAQKAGARYTIPGTTRDRVAAETIRDWLQDYRQGGFDALLPKERKDRGQSHALPQAVVDRLLTTKEHQPELTVAQVIAQTRKAGELPVTLSLPRSTVHRLLTHHGLMVKQQAESATKDHRRFEFPQAGDLWMSDVMHGPAVFVTGQTKHKTYLIAFLDDATRVVPFAAFALAETTAAFLGVFKQALLRRGLPVRLFVDNGAAFRCHHLALVCAKLGIALIHARPYHPQAKGKIERWFRTVRTQLLPLLSPADLRSLEALNRRLWAYVEGEYHHTPHRGLDGETPLDHWALKAATVRYVDQQLDLDDLFLQEVQRRVQKDRTVCLNGQVYEVATALVHETVTLRFDPAHPGRPVQVWCAGQHVQDARLVDVHANCFVRRTRPVSTPASGSDPAVPAAPPTPCGDPESTTPCPAPPVGLRLADLADRAADAADAAVEGC